MDYQNRVGSKKGSGGVAGNAETNQYRRERLRQLMLSQIDLDNDPYVFKNHMGMLECRLCLTTHLSESSYVTHTHGKKHQTALMRRAELDKKPVKQEQGKVVGISAIPKKKYTKIGRPAYKVTKIRDQDTFQKGLLFQVQLPELASGVKPKYRLMSCFEQKIEPLNTNFQYLVVSGEPYENIGFKIPSEPIDMAEGRIWDFWDNDTKEYFVQLFYSDKN
ncbi:hypothetical protein OGAPHI_003928 [Ogataea philodendri]|uniref:Matrin-type domain-containing protein n=1 Tax=Ogataea philodendri TaxID=1378263 RepID=A0A9P8P649_9ASCO|nr:uncharacterized protein OGAPHI_003928 [Ogataea philodendri]KAH3665740.1 hypothetical protein OGAPHI_003928 [Ogataea philodendri]